MLTSMFATLTSGGLLLVAAADQLPTLNIGPTCTAAAGELTEILRPDRCEKSEQEARTTLASEWSKFHAADRRECLALTRVGGFPSYVQVLTCLEIARDVRGSPKD